MDEDEIMVEGVVILDSQSASDSVWSFELLSDKGTEIENYSDQVLQLWPPDSDESMVIDAIKKFKLNEGQVGTILFTYRLLLALVSFFIPT